MKIKTVIISFALSVTVAFSQEADTSRIKYRQITKEEKKAEFKKTLYVATPLIAVGLLAKIDNDFFSDRVFEDARNKNFDGFNSNFDDYLAAAPIITVFAADAIFQNAKTDGLNQVAILIKAELIMSAIVFPLKEVSKQERPDGSNTQSFPSGHTAQAFLGATFLHKEFGDRSIWYSIGAYGTASAVGIYRVLNNKHYINDVLVGAGVGVLSTKLAYFIHQYKWSKRTNLVFVPTYSNKTPGFALGLKF